MCTYLLFPLKCSTWSHAQYHNSQETFSLHSVSDLFLMGCHMQETISVYHMLQETFSVYHVSQQTFSLGSVSVFRMNYYVFAQMSEFCLVSTCDLKKPVKNDRAVTVAKLPNRLFTKHYFVFDSINRIPYYCSHASW